MQRLPLFRRPEVLIINARRQVAAALLDVLGEQSVEVMVASSAEDGLRVAHATQPDVILLDPGLADGLAVCRRLQGAVQTRHIPVILLAHLPSGPLRCQALGDGAVDFLVHPIPRHTLLARVYSQFSVAPYQDWRGMALASEIVDHAGNRCSRSLQIVLAINALQQSTATGGLQGCLLVDHLAEHLEIGSTELDTVLQQQFGMTAWAYLTLLRLDRARHRMRSSALSVARIAERADFGTLCQFVRAFRQRYGVGPRQYQRLCRADDTQSEAA